MVYIEAGSYYKKNSMRRYGYKSFGCSASGAESTKNHIGQVVCKLKDDNNIL